MVRNWRVQKALHQSDYLRILFGLGMEALPIKRKWNPKAANLNKFRELMEEKDNTFLLHKLWTPDTVEQEVKPHYRDTKYALS